MRIGAFSVLNIVLVLDWLTISRLVATLFPGRFNMFRVSFTLGAQDDYVYWCGPEHDDKTGEDSSWMMEWLLVFQQTGVGVRADFDARL
jgi:hypothetical protein